MWRNDIEGKMKYPKKHMSGLLGNMAQDVLNLEFPDYCNEAGGVTPSLCKVLPASVSSLLSADVCRSSQNSEETVGLQNLLQRAWYRRENRSGRVDQLVPVGQVVKGKMRPVANFGTVFASGTPLVTTREDTVAADGAWYRSPSLHSGSVRD